MKDQKKLADLFGQMGLSNLEASVYIWLLENKRSTGYKIATKIGKPVANTYKALKSLERKGAVISDNTSNKLYYDTIPAEQFLNKIENEFIKKRERIIEEVDKLDVKQEPIGIYELQSQELVYEKAAHMIESAEHSLLIDCFPTPLSKIKPHILKRATGGIDIFLKHYADEVIEGVRQIKRTQSDIVLDELLGQWLIIIKDANETLIAFFDRSGEEMIHSVWIQDAFISLIHFSGSAIECLLFEILEKVYNDDNATIDSIKQIVRSYQSIFSYFNIAEKEIFRSKK